MQRNATANPITVAKVVLVPITHGLAWRCGDEIVVIACMLSSLRIVVSSTTATSSALTCGGGVVHSIATGHPTGSHTHLFNWQGLIAPGSSRASARGAMNIARYTVLSLST
jgi:hypothetical protein